MKKVIVLFDDLGKEASPFDKSLYKQGYKELSEVAAKKDLQIVFARGGNDAYLGNNMFKNCSVFDGDDLIDFEDTIADAVLDKSKYFKPDNILGCINHQKIKNICIDKLLTSTSFPAYSPATLLVNTNDELEIALLEHGDSIVVIKPVDGSAGTGVQICAASKVEISTILYPVILQEFIDSSAGIKGIVDGLHDLRANVINGEIFFAFFRTPGPNDYRAGIATGGELNVIEPEKVPLELIEIVKEVDRVFSQYGPRLYTVDVAFDGSKYRLIELNSQPGILPSSFNEAYGYFQSKVVDLMKAIA